MLPSTATIGESGGPSAAGVLRAILTEPFRARTWRETFYNVLAFPLGLLWLIVFTVMLATGFALIPLALVGLVILFLALLIAQGAAVVEREVAGVLLGTPTVAPVRRAPNGTGPVAHFWARMIDPVTWKEFLYLALCFPVGLASFVAAVAMWATALFGITTPLFAWILVESNSEDTSAMWIRGPDVVIDEVVLNITTGALVFLLAPWVMRVFALLREAMLRILLGPTREQELEHEVERLADSRAKSVDVAAAERMRIERDLHDGAQARLVSLAMDLGRARERLDREGDASEAATLVAEAHEEAKRALGELRNLARGIHPSVLTDRGLDAALSSMVARSPVPVTLVVDLPERPSQRVEAVAYFVLSELLTNVARHSRAGSARVRVAIGPPGEGGGRAGWVADDRSGDDERHDVVPELAGERGRGDTGAPSGVGGRGDVPGGVEGGGPAVRRLVLEVHDDGVGGADPAVGTGLAGLRDRVETLDGSMEITSPLGGPTTVHVDLPFV